MKKSCKTKKGGCIKVKVTDLVGIKTTGWADESTPSPLTGGCSTLSGAAAAALSLPVSLRPQRKTENLDRSSSA